MADLEIQNLHVTVEGKEILKGVDLKVSRGEVHALMGPNGSGKSTLANTILGHPSYEITEGRSSSRRGPDRGRPDERARAGLFMAFQYPSAIPGVSVVNFLRTAINAQRKARGEDPINLKEFRKTLEHQMELLGVDREFTRRYLNEGFSGGEKKRCEILQMAILKPVVAVLDETDSGLDIDALRTVANAVNAMRGPDLGVLIITHYQRILSYIQPDFVHIMLNGRIVEEGGPELAAQLEDKGYEWVRESEPSEEPPPDGGGHGHTGLPRRRRDPADFPVLARRVNGKPLVYLDNAATAQKPASVIEAIGRYYRELERQHPPQHAQARGRGDRALRGRAARASRLHRRARRGDRVRAQRDRGDQPGRATPGAREVGAGDAVVLTRMEHHSNLVPWQLLCEERGASSSTSRSTDEGRLDLAGLDALLATGTKLVAVAHVSNVLGTINPVAEIARRAHAAGAKVLIDGAQAVPQLPVDVGEIGADFYAFTGHKMLGPTGHRRALGPARAARGDAAVHGRRLDDQRGRGRPLHLGAAAREVRGRHAARSPRRSASAPPSTTSTTLGHGRRPGARARAHRPTRSSAWRRSRARGSSARRTRPTAAAS